MKYENKLYEFMSFIRIIFSAAARVQSSAVSLTPLQFALFFDVYIGNTTSKANLQTSEPNASMPKRTE